MESRAAFRKLPLTKRELRTIAGNVAPSSFRASSYLLGSSTGFTYVIANGPIADTETMVAPRAVA
jgi:hypothetical protein